ncbi:hypothetical protein F7734_00975 [Scytonema sp. UIC 10036]|nr:hypothetical protein [Scytonema sp. UIC 10036]MUG91147.1 hypothetical protein [Scytonema sp. UIC 10036]
MTKPSCNARSNAVAISSGDRLEAIAKVFKSKELPMQAAILKHPRY